MGDQVYRVEELRLQVLAVLRRNQPMKTGAICMALGVPLWAVFAALESAVTAKLVVYLPGVGYELADDIGEVAV
jgi:hypothetical protein